MFETPPHRFRCGARLRVAADCPTNGAKDTLAGGPTEGWCDRIKAADAYLDERWPDEYCAEHLLVGSVTERICRFANVPVLAVR